MAIPVRFYSVTPEEFDRILKRIHEENEKPKDDPREVVTIENLCKEQETSIIE